MAALGSVVVELSANIAKFQSDFGKAAAIAEERARQIDKSLSIVKNALGAIGVGFAVGATIDKIKEKITSAIESAAGLQQLSERTGVAASALSALSGVAKLSGTSTEELGTGLQKLSKSLIDAQNGGEKTSASFEAIGISVDSIRGKKPDEVFKLIADKLATFQDGAEKVVIAQNLLGKAGANLLPVLNDLAEVGDLQAKVTDEQARAADEYDKNQRRLTASTNALFKTIALELVPALNTFTVTLLESQNANDGVRKSVKDLAADGSIKTFAQQAVTAVGFVIDAFDGVSRVVQISGKAIGALAASVGFVARDGLVGGAKNALAALDEFGKDADKILEKQTFGDRLKANFAKANAEGEKTKKLRSVINTSGLGNQNDAKGPKDDPAQKLLDGQLKAQEDFIASNAKLLSQREAQLSFYSGLEFITLREELETKKRLIAENLATNSAAYEVEKKLLEDRIRTAGTEVKRQDARNKLQEAIKRQSEAEIDANNKLIQSDEALLAIKQRFVLATAEISRQADKSNAAAQFQIDLLGQSTINVQKLNAAKSIQIALEERIFQLKDSNPGVDVLKAIEQAQAQADEQIRQSSDLIEKSYIKQQSGAFGASEAIRKYGEEASNSGAQIESSLTGAFKSAEDALVQFTLTGKFSFGDFARSVIADLARMQAKAAVSGFANFLGKAIQSAFGPSVGDESGALFSATGADVAGRRASGGPVGAGGRYLVGENGPEILTMGGSSGTIIPNSAFGDQAGSIQIVQNINIDSRSDQQSIRDAMKQSVEQAKAAISDAIARGSRQYTRPA